MSDWGGEGRTRAGKASTIFFYFGALTLLVALASPAGYLLDIASSYMLKNRLHAPAEAVAKFRLYTAIPVYFAFVFGQARDRWNPFGLKDRGIFMLFAPVTAAVFVWMAFSEVSYRGLFVGVLVALASSRMVAAAHIGLMSLIGQEKRMSGRLSALLWIATSIPSAIAAWASGFVTEHLRPRQTFLILAALAFGIALMGFWKPRAVFRETYERPEARTTDFVGDVKRLLRHRAIYPAVLIVFLWSFAPGSATPLQYYLTNHLGASDAVYANFTAIFCVSFIPTYLLYGYLCRRVAHGKLLFWGTLVAVPQMVPLALIHSATAALWLAIPIGLLGGIATAAFYDLAMRSCPPGLQGTLMTIVDGVLVLAVRGGDVIGAKIYASDPEHGFLHCVIATTIVYALILPIIALVPKHIRASSDARVDEVEVIMARSPDP